MADMVNMVWSASNLSEMSYPNKYDTVVGEKLGC